MEKDPFMATIAEDAAAHLSTSRLVSFIPYLSSF
jgi:hypothetical protein